MSHHLFTPDQRHSRHQQHPFTSREHLPIMLYGNQLLGTKGLQRGHGGGLYHGPALPHFETRWRESSSSCPGGRTVVKIQVRRPDTST